MLSDSLSPDLLLGQIMAGLRHRYASLNRHYEVWWSDSGWLSSCQHRHDGLRDAVTCGMAQRAGWYLVAVEFDTPRELTAEENKIVDTFRFGQKARRGASGKVKPKPSGTAVKWPMFDWDAIWKTYNPSAPNPLLLVCMVLEFYQRPVT
jgi:hypothetical protein